MSGKQAKNTPLFFINETYSDETYLKLTCLLDDCLTREAGVLTDDRAPLRI